MKILIDTNVILDVLTGREPYCESSAAVLKLCGTQTTGLISATQTTDLFYLLRREGKGAVDAKAVLQQLIDHLKVIDATESDVKNALASNMTDYEDALLAFGGKRHRADYLVTRNGKDFLNSPVSALSPQAFLEQFFGDSPGIK